MDTDTDTKISQSLTPMASVKDPLMPGGMHEMGETYRNPVELPLSVLRSELGTGELEGDRKTQWVDDRAAAGYEGAYRGN